MGTAYAVVGSLEMSADQRQHGPPDGLGQRWPSRHDSGKLGRQSMQSLRRRCTRRCTVRRIALFFGLFGGTTLNQNPRVRGSSPCAATWEKSGTRDQGSGVSTKNERRITKNSFRLIPDTGRLLSRRPQFSRNGSRSVWWPIIFQLPFSLRNRLVARMEIFWVLPPTFALAPRS